MKIIATFRFIFSGLIIYLTTGCDTVIDIEIPDHEPRMVLNSFFGTDTTFCITLSEDRSILDSLDGYDEVNNEVNNKYGVSWITGADVRIYEEDQLIGLAEEVIKDIDTHAKEMYYELDLHPQAGKTYTIIAYKAGYPEVRSTSQVPDKFITPRITKIVKDKRESSNDFELTFSFDDPPGKNFYEILIYRYRPYSYWIYEDEDTSYLYIEEYARDLWGFTALDTDYEDQNKLDELVASENPSLLSDDLFEGSTYTTTVKSWGPDEDEFLTMELRSVSEAYYKYLSGIQQQIETRGDHFSEPAPVYSNIQNGFGIFASYNVVSVPLIVEE